MQQHPSGDPAHHDPSSAPIRSEQDLFAPFEASFRQGRQLIGLEAEKFGVRADGTPLQYTTVDGVPALFTELCARFGWRPERETDGGPVLSLTRDGAAITLEPGSQFEFSGSPCEDVHAVMAEVEQHRAELAALQSARPYRWLGLGFHPFAHPDALDWVPKSRYPTMREYLPTRGAFGLDMMRRTSTVQANYDIASEADAMRKLRGALAISPIVQALFANSAVYEDVRHPIKSHRAEVWLDVDNQRAGLLPFAWQDGASLGDYVRWALAMPMFIVKRDGKPLRATHLTFADFMAHGLDGQHATQGDWESHLNTLFPEVRLKRTIEVRSADSVPSGYSAALPALWAGVLYDDAALAEAAALAVPLGYDAWQSARPMIAAKGLGAVVAGRPLAALAQRLLAIAEQALARRARKDAAGRDERVYLAPLTALAARGQCIGDAVLGDWSPAMPHAREQLIERAAY